MIKLNAQKEIVAKKSGFTLIELLVVISIIGLMVSILLPALKSAREQARSMVCASNLRGLGVGFNLYADDYSDYYPVVADLSTSQKLLTDLEKYFQGPEVWDCPSEENPDVIDGKQYAYCAPFHLGYILASGNPFSGHPTYSRKRRMDATAPHRTTIMFDALPRNNFAGYDLSIRGMWEPSWRHTNEALCNFLFMDLHMSSYRSDIVPSAFIVDDPITGEPSYQLYFVNYDHEPTFHWFDPWS